MPSPSGQRTSSIWWYVATVSLAATRCAILPASDAGGHQTFGKCRSYQSMSSSRLRATIDGCKCALSARSSRHLRPKDTSPPARRREPRACTRGSSFPMPQSWRRAFACEGTRLALGAGPYAKALSARPALCALPNQPGWYTGLTPSVRPGITNPPVTSPGCPPEPLMRRRGYRGRRPRKARSRFARSWEISCSDIDGVLPRHDVQIARCSRDAPLDPRSARLRHSG
jgi:hypothetical protein